MIVTGAFNALLRPLTRGAWRDAYSEIPEEYSNFLRVGRQEGAYVEAIQMGGLPRMVKRGEAEPITYVDPAIGDKVEWVDDEYALGVMVSRRALEDDQFGKVRQGARWLGRSARLTQEYLGASFLDDMFAGNIYRGLDGQPLVSDNHTMIGQPGLLSNRLATGTQLSITGMQAAFDLAASTKDIDGNPLPWTPRVLWAGIRDEWAAIQLAKNEAEPYTSDRNINAIRARGGFTYQISHYKNQNGDWAIVDPAILDAWFLFRIRPENDDTYDFDTKAAKYSCRQRINVYFANWHGIVASSAT